MNISLLSYWNSLFYSLWPSIFRETSICLVRTLRPRGREVRKESVKGTGPANFFNRRPSSPLPSRFDRADVGNVGYPVTIRQWISGFSEISFVFLIEKRIEVGEVISRISHYNVHANRIELLRGCAAKLISIISPNVSNLNFGGCSLLYDLIAVWSICGRK